MKIVIRAGGGGTRLWPLSTSKLPKQFQKILSDQTMVQDTYRRIKRLLKDKDDLIVSVNESHSAILKEQLPEVPDENIIVEPAKKNTGAALCLEACFVESKWNDPNIVIATLPSDDYINSSVAFCNMLKKTAKFLKEKGEYVATPGITPDTVDIGYSYIKTGRKIEHLNDHIFIYEITDWIEKPDYKKCQKLIESGEYFYHTGMYIWKVSTAINLFEKFQPKMLKICRETIDLMQKGKKEKAKKIFNKVEEMSVESAITQRCENLAMVVSNKVKWSDVGKWYIFPKLMKEDSNGNIVRGNHIGKETHNSLIIGDNDKLVATLEIDNLAIIDTPKALFVSDLQRSGEVKELLKKVKKKYPELV